MRMLRHAIILACVPLAALRAQAVNGAESVRRVDSEAQDGGARPATVADIIGLTMFGPRHWLDTDVRSPNGKYAAFVLRRGDLARNANVYTLVVFRTDLNTA